MDISPTGQFADRTFRGLGSWAIGQLTDTTVHKQENFFMVFYLQDNINKNKDNKLVITAQHNKTYKQEHEQI